MMIVLIAPEGGGGRDCMDTVEFREGFGDEDGRIKKRAPEEVDNDPRLLRWNGGVRPEATGN